MPILASLWLAAAVAARAATPAPAMSTSPPSNAVLALPRATEVRIDALIGRMTLREKLGQLTIVGADHGDLEAMVRAGEVGGTNGVLADRDVGAYTRHMQQLAMQSRLKIPLLFMGDVTHGFRTIFPMPLALASSWDPALVERVHRAAAEEATAAGVDWTFGPMLDISRDPRWGRVDEGAGEDPFLGAAMATAQVRGFQGTDLADPRTMMATAKHFAGYGAVEAGRDYNSVDLPPRLLHAVYLPPFRAAVRAGVGSVMAAFTTLDGVPSTANRALLTNLLRGQWGFDGLLVSDFDAVPQLQQHGVAASPGDAAALALHAGVDVDLHSGTYLATLADAVRAGRVPITEVDAAVRRVLEAKARLGLFDDPFRYNHDAAGAVPPSADHLALAREAAGRSMVLLKNDAHTLPLDRRLERIAVIGPLADDRADLLGNMPALGRAGDVTPVLEGIRQAVAPHTRVSYARGSGFDDDDRSGFAQAVAAARNADVAVLVVGEDDAMIGEADSRSRIGLPGVQQDLVRAVAGTGTPVVVVLMNGRPLAIPWLQAHVAAILEAWIPGDEGGPAVADVLFGAVNPSGKLPMSFPRDVGQIPLHYDALPTGRPFDPTDKYTSRYVDVANTPLYPFGYGLSYTTFAYGPLQLDRDTLPWDGRLRVSVRVTNTGARAGSEVVQLYLHQPVASVSRPRRQLRGFRRVTLAAGASREVTFTLDRDTLAFVGTDLKWHAEPGRFEVYVGGDSDATDEAGFTLQAPPAAGPVPPDRR